MDIIVWASNILESINNELNDSSVESSQELISCQQRLTENICKTINHPKDYGTMLSDILEYAYKKLQSHHHNSVPFSWRRLYTDAALIWSLLDVTTFTSPSDIGNESIWRASIARLDRGIIIAGAAGEGRLDLILDTIERIQSTYLPLNVPFITTSNSQAKITSSASKTNLKRLLPVPNTSQSIPALSNPPSLASFLTKYSKAPFILSGFALDWPAISDHPWSSKSYLQSVAGQGRVVPVEIGNDYRADDWSQKFMDWGDYLDYLFPDRSQTTERSLEMIYLAQHNLFRQFERLRWDVVIPDYVYTQLPPPEYFPKYKPPSNDEKLVMNGWLGPEKAMSPAHTDPYFNFYTQVVGTKTIWLAPPNVSNAMFSYNCKLLDPLIASSSFNSDDGSAPRNPATNQMNPALSNSSRIDVFRNSNSNTDISDELKEEYRVFEEVVVPQAMGAVLEPGDMLFFPPGWWHAMRCEDTSFSVSLWF